MIATSDSTRRGADALLWTVYVLAPSFGAGLVHGVPLGRLGAVALLLICMGIRKASGSWVFAVATVLLIALCPFDLALSSVIWNPVLAVTFVKIGIGLLLAWAVELTRPRRLVVFAVAWLAVQAHTPALPVALSIVLGLVLLARQRGVSGRRIDAPFVREATDPEFLFRVLGGRIDRQAPMAARISARGEVSYVH